MTVLLDTHVLIWAAQDSPRLSEETRGVLDDTDQDVLFGVAGIWEVIIKNSLQRGDFHLDGAALRTAAIAPGPGELPIRGHHVIEVVTLPDVHADPFDRILLAQACADELTLLTADRRLLQYGSPAKPA